LARMMGMVRGWTLLYPQQTEISKTLRIHHPSQLVKTSQHILQLSVNGKKIFI
jgi:hypothetical protein